MLVGLSLDDPSSDLHTRIREMERVQSRFSGYLERST